MPLLALASIYIFCAIFHLFVVLLDGDGGFKGTFHVLAYSGIANLFHAIPFVGAIIGIVWGMVICVIGAKRVHKFNTTEAVIAFVIPTVIIAIIVFALVSLVLGPQKKNIEANQKTAVETLKNIARAIESFAGAHNGKYPKDEYELRYFQGSLSDRAYNNETIQGYAYLLNLNPEGYEVWAAPVQCGRTGIMFYKVKTGGVLYNGDCRSANIK